MRSLQINLNSADDAKSVIAHLGKIKEFYEQQGCDSVEFYFAAPVRNAIEAIVTGAIPWTKTFRKEIPVGEGNIYMPLPHYIPPQTPPKPKAVTPPVATVANEPVKRGPGRPRKETIGNTSRPVPATFDAT